MLGCTEFKYRIPQFHFSCKYDMILSLFGRLVAVLCVSTESPTSDALSYEVELVEKSVTWLDFDAASSVHCERLN